MDRHTHPHIQLTDEDRKYFKQLRTAKIGTILKCRTCGNLMELIREVGWIHDDETCKPTDEQIETHALKMYLYEREVILDASE